KVNENKGEKINVTQYLHSIDSTKKTTEFLTAAGQDGGAPTVYNNGSTQDAH
uniref:Opacity protein (Clone 10) (Fragments) n=1 Tax=Neisseria gonorrhoeae TaxID=485 RepID=Q7M0T3_NEIGO